MVQLDKNQIREAIARRIALEFHDGDVVNLGIGIPTHVPNYVPKDIHLIVHSENGIIGMGPNAAPGMEDIDFQDAGGRFTTALPGASTFDTSLSFLITRGGHVDVTVLGAMQVDENGDLANWKIPGKLITGMGGAMDLLVGAKRVVIAMEHTSGESKKILKRCSLPLTAKGVVDLIVTEMGVLEITPEGIVLREINPVFTVEEVQAQTEATLIISKSLCGMKQSHVN
jgi:acetate CoA/acetoacetate CoA-transferase beta subunit